MSAMQVSRDSLVWRKSRRSGVQGKCVELADAGGVVAVRNSRQPDGALLAFPAAGMAAFLDAVKSGELDHIG